MTADTRYPALRSALAAPYSELSDETLEETIPHLLGAGITAEDAEGFFDQVSKAFQTVSRAVQRNPLVGRALSGAVAGAVPGLAGGPIGALLGAGTGALGALLGGGGGGGGPAATARVGAAGATGAGGTVAQQLLGVLARPEATQAITQLAMGRSGKTAVPLGRGGAQVRASDFAQLIGFLGNRLAEDAQESTEPGWLATVDGADPASPADRAAALMSLLAITTPVAVAIEPEPDPAAARRTAPPAAHPGTHRYATAPPPAPSGIRGADTAPSWNPGEPTPAGEEPRRVGRRRHQPVWDRAAAEALAEAAADLEAAALQSLARELAS